MEKLIKNKKLMSGLGILVGIALCPLYVFLVHLSEDIYILVIAGVCCVLGISLLIINLVNFSIFLRNPKTSQSQDTAFKDKRNTITGDNAASRAKFIIKIYVKNKILVGMTVFGVVLVTISLVLTYNFYSTELETLYYVCGGLGAALIGYVLIGFLMSWYSSYQIKKEPEAYRKTLIEARDERNVILWEKALARAIAIVAPVSVAVSLLFYLIGAEWYFIATPFGLMVLTFILALVYQNYLKKRM
jgi:hypothetical protein